MWFRENHTGRKEQQMWVQSYLNKAGQRTFQLNIREDEIQEFIELIDTIDAKLTDDTLAHLRAEVEAQAAKA